MSSSERLLAHLDYKETKIREKSDWKNTNFKRVIESKGKFRFFYHSQVIRGTYSSKTEISWLVHILTLTDERFLVHFLRF
jgi:hypothetical protein